MVFFLQALHLSRRKRMAARASGNRSAIAIANRQFRETIRLGSHWLGLHFVQFVPHLAIQGDVVNFTFQF